MLGKRIGIRLIAKTFRQLGTGCIELANLRSDRLSDSGEVLIRQHKSLSLSQVGRDPASERSSLIGIVLMQRSTAKTLMLKINRSVRDFYFVLYFWALLSING